MRYIQLKPRKYFVSACGQCPFFDFEYDSFYGEYHKCKAVKGLIVDIRGIPERCPLEEETELEPENSYACHVDGSRGELWPV
jgi:hypothetical protein